MGYPAAVLRLPCSGVAGLSDDPAVWHFPSELAWLSRHRAADHGRLHHGCPGAASSEPPDAGGRNLIVLPLQHEARSRGCTVFVDDKLREKAKKEIAKEKK